MVIAARPGHAAPVGTAVMSETTRRRRAHLRRLARAAIEHGAYRQPLTLPEMAGRLGVSPRTLQRAYAEAGGATFAEELREVRLRSGAELLAGQPLAVADVARLVGYRSAPAFAAAFARRYGLTPAGFRAAARRARASRPTPTARTAQTVEAARVRRARGPPLTRPPTAATARGS
jgi:AraC-like DNA-binding protein